MKIEADFTQISTEFQNPAEGNHTFKLEEIEEGESSSKLPMLTFISKCTASEQPENVGRQVRDFVVLKKKDGSANEISLGRVKAYAEAILGKEAANGKALNTDDLKGGSFIGVMKNDSYEKDMGNGQKQTIATTKLAKILPA